MNIESIPASAPASAAIAATSPSDVFAEVERLRAEIETVTDELTWAENSALPKVEAKRRATEAFASLKGQFRLPVWHFAEPNPGNDVLREMMVAHGVTQIVRETHTRAEVAQSSSQAEAEEDEGRAAWPRVVQRGAQPQQAPNVGYEGSMSIGAVSINLTELMLGLFGDELLAKVLKQIDELDYTAGPASEDRPAMLKKLKGTLRDLGMREESLICEAEERGIFIPRRADADPAVVLGYTADGVQLGPDESDSLNL